MRETSTSFWVLKLLTMNIFPSNCFKLFWSTINFSSLIWSTTSLTLEPLLLLLKTSFTKIWQTSNAICHGSIEQLLECCLAFRGTLVPTCQCQFTNIHASATTLCFVMRNLWWGLDTISSALEKEASYTGLTSLKVWNATLMPTSLEGGRRMTLETQITCCLELTMS